MPEIPPLILDRVRADAVLFTADDIATWPPDLLDELVACGVLRPEQPTRAISCDACGDDHVEIVQYVESPPGTGLRAYIQCPELGRVPVPTARLRCWSIDTSNASVVAALAQSDIEQNAPATRKWPKPDEHTTAKFWTRKNGVVCLSTKTDSNHDGTVEFAPTVLGALTYQMRFMQLMCFKFPGAVTLAEVIEQVYPDDFAKAKQNPDLLKSTLRKLRTLVSDIRNKKLAKAGLNPEILPSLSIEATMATGIVLRLAHLHRMDDKELDEADESAV